jgi:ribosomal protein S15P/S13E
MLIVYRLGSRDIAIEEQYQQLKEQYAEFQRHLAEKEKDSQSSGNRMRGLRSLLHRGSRADLRSMIKQEESGTQNAPTKLSTKQAGLFAPDIEGVREAVLYAKKEWEKKPRLFSGRAQSCFEKCCDTLNNHIGLLSLLPDQSEYFSILCGGIKVIIKVSKIFYSHKNTEVEISPRMTLENYEG